MYQPAKKSYSKMSSLSRVHTSSIGRMNKPTLRNHSQRFSQCLLVSTDFQMSSSNPPSTSEVGIPARPTFQPHMPVPIRKCGLTSLSTSKRPRHKTAPSLLLSNVPTSLNSHQFFLIFTCSAYGEIRRMAGTSSHNVSEVGAADEDSSIISVRMCCPFDAS